MERELRLIVDQREKNAELLEALASSSMSVEIKTLPVGDYVVSDRVCIERKSVSDFEGSMVSGRLFEQVGRLKEAYQSPLLLVEGDIDSFRMNRTSIYGAIVSIYVKYGMPVLLSRNALESAQIIKAIANQEQYADERLPSLKGGLRAYTDNQFQEYVIGNLPGIGPKLARALLAHFGSVRKISNARPEQLAKVDKIGKKKAARIYGIFNSAYKES
ncbi:helix-hairpin-helix domain-containing protein [Candidatus Marsarchaeota archaeon]|jgi:Fanconi anemia group M protein|nr:helix-hairpin-helix domain-containing protein [Candidatus Marsarchaeota archaeon]MCL5100078.1 helix-hairpin-helix domain-containing protein [Candidatus Marsarchaeota archaeon]